MVSKKQNVCPQNPMFAIDDALLCDEQEHDFDFGYGFAPSDQENQILNDKASKVEEIQAPFLLDLQMEGTEFVFESKTIMKMELLVLSSLDWKMNLVTPLAFVHYIMRNDS
ncbi:putative cyclin [Helianthus anomalus]